MPIICWQGNKISAPDLKVWQHYLLDTPLQWGQKAVKGMASKSIKQILKDWIPLYKSKNEGQISSNIADIISGIVTLPDFKAYNVPSLKYPDIDRLIPMNIEVWEGGFEVEEYEQLAMINYFAGVNEYLFVLFENQIAQRRKQFVEEMQAKLMNDPTVTEIPVDEDALIVFACGQENYKNRAQREVS